MYSYYYYHLNYIDVKKVFIEINIINIKILFKLLKHSDKFKTMITLLQKRDVCIVFDSHTLMKNCLKSKTIQNIHQVHSSHR